MTDAMTIPAAIQWHEGMLLAPQHFQQLSWRYEALLHYHAMAMTPFHWGVCHLKIDTALLVSGTLRILELEAIMPDGLIVSHDDTDSEALELDLLPYVETLRHGHLPIHLAVPAQHADAAVATGSLARYRSYEGTPITDENTGEGELRIPRLRPCPTLLATATPPQKYVSFPLLHIQYANETFERTDFVPPTIRILPTSPLGTRCAAIAKRLREKAVFLSEKARTPSAAMSGAQLLEIKLNIHSLVAALPAFETILASGVAHPYPLYLALSALVGHVAAVGTSMLPPVCAPYNHHDLLSTFAQAQAFIFRVLAEGIHETYTAMPFTYQDGVFSLYFDGAWMTRRLVLGVQGQPGMSEREVITWVEESLIASHTTMQALREKRILGARRQRLEADRELVPGRGVVLFALQPDTAFIHANDILQMTNPPHRHDALRPISIVLYIRDETTTQTAKGESL
jgi:type VI secretion system protein ImpJ